MVPIQEISTNTEIRY